MDPSGLGFWGWVERHTIGPAAKLIADNVSGRTTDGIGNFSAGVGDNLLMGQGDRLRRVAGVDDQVDPCSDAYRYGGYAETGAELLIGVGALKGALKQGLKTGAKTMCFAGETLVETIDGSVPIRDIQVGDLVWSQDDETGEVGWKPVVKLYITPNKQLVDLDLLEADGDAQELVVTAEHPLWTETGWTQVGDLVAGNVVWARDGWATVTSVRASNRTETVYNFEVEDFHTYFVGDGGIWAHNVCDATKLARDILPGSLKRKFPGEHLNKSLNDIKGLLTSATGAEKNLFKLLRSFLNSKHA